MRDQNNILISETDILNRLRLIRSPHVGPITFHRLMARFKTAEAALDGLPGLARSTENKGPVRICSIAAAEKEMEKCRAAQIQILTPDNPCYPPRLKHIVDAPPLLFVRGNTEMLRKKAVAVIGARNASGLGRRFAEQLAGDLGRSGLLVVSGLARGVDTAAHWGAVETGTGAVLGGGVDILYPRENAALYDKIAERGVLISEMPMGTVPKAAHFPRRNRIISGISRGIVVVEAALRSGSLITARLALEQGREVFAVPGSAADPRARGTNDLIRQGAILTETADDVLNVICPEPRILPMQHTPSIAPPTQNTQPLPPEQHGYPCNIRQWLETRLGSTPIEVDDLAREASSSSAILAEALMELELAGRLERHPGNMVSATFT